MKRKDILIQVILAFLLIGIQYGLKQKEFRKKHQYYQEMLTASTRMKTLMEEVKKEKRKRGFPIDKNIDIHETGMLGEEWSGITTTLGSLESKRTSTNPDFAALLLKILKEQGLKKGDIVAANLSSSFPALNIAFLSAVDVLGLEGILVNSVGSSTYGANLEEFTYLDMENYLYSQGRIKNRTRAYSLGGGEDIGEEFDKRSRENIIKRNQSYGLQFFYNPAVEANIEERYQYFHEEAKRRGRNGKIMAFVNIGGNILSLGKSANTMESANALLDKNLKVKDGLVGKFLEEGVPVYYFLDLKHMSNRYGIPFDPALPPRLGLSDIYFQEVSNLWNYVIVILVGSYLLYILYKKKTGYR